MLVNEQALRAACHVVSTSWPLSGDQIYRLYKEVESNLAPSPRAQALEDTGNPVNYDHAEAMQVLAKCACKACGGTGERNDADCGDMYFNTWVCDGCDGQGWDRQAYFEAFPAIRALSSQPVANALPQDVINLVIAAREAWETWQLPEEEFKRLDAALEAFASRVPYENEPDEDVVEVIPSSGCVFADMGVERPVADGWLPIETAPKDGTQFLAYNIANGYYNCWWHKNHHGEEYWMDEADTEPNPTHWRPLPASPGASE